MENFVVGCLLLAAIAFMAIAAFAVFGPRRKEGVIKRAPSAEAVLAAIEENDDEDPIEVRLERLERSLRMLVGRVNKVSPPREGTGKGNGKEAAPESPEEPERPMTRSQLYARALKRRQGAG